MSKFYKPLNISQKHKNLQWINLIVGQHDMLCHCDDPLKHTIFAILEQEPSIKFTEEESKQLQKCLTSTDQGDGAGGVDDFGDGELERLFAEDTIGETADTG